MRLSSSFPLIFLLLLVNCQIPRPIVTEQYVAKCPPSTQEPPAGSKLFITLRLPDCRPGRAVLTERRAEKLRFAALDGGGGLMFFDRASWLSALAKRAAMRGGKPPVIFIHGYNNSNDEALDRAEAIARAVKRHEVVALTWPSYGRKRAYFWDETNAEWAGGGARKAISEILTSFPKLIIIAHSMGNRPALEAVAELKAKGQASRVERLIMASPDVDRDSLAALLQPERGLGTELTMYVSLKDQALSGSWRGHAYPRAGDFSWWVSGRDPYYAYAWLPHVEVIDTTEVDQSRLGHSAFIDTRAGAADLCRVLLGMGPDRPGVRHLPGTPLNYLQLDNTANDGC